MRMPHSLSTAPNCRQCAQGTVAVEKQPRTGGAEAGLVLERVGGGCFPPLSVTVCPADRLSAPNGPPTGLYPPETAYQPPLTAFTIALQTPLLVLAPVPPPNLKRAAGARVGHQWPSNGPLGVRH